jgi:hypothetical protein
MPILVRAFALVVLLIVGLNGWPAVSVAFAQEAPGPAQPPPDAPAESLPACSQPSPLPPDIAIVPPPDALDPKVKAFSGAWEGRWGDSLPSRLIIEQLGPTMASGVYAWADHPQGQFTAGWRRIQYQVLPEGKLVHEVKETRQGRFYSLAFTFVMGDALNAVYGVREQQLGPTTFPPANVTMTRCVL